MKLLRTLVAVGVVGVAFEGLEALLTRHFYSRTYNYYQAADVYWEDQHTLLLYLPHRALFWTLRPSIRMKAADVTSAPHLRPEWSQQTRYAWEIHVSAQGFRGDDFAATGRRRGTAADQTASARDRRFGGGAWTDAGG